MTCVFSVFFSLNTLHVTDFHYCSIFTIVVLLLLRAQKEEEHDEDSAPSAKSMGVKDNMIYFHLKLPPNMQVMCGVWCVMCDV